MKIVELALLWEGTLALLVTIGVYITGRWWKEHVTRYNVALEVGLLALVTNGLVTSITRPSTFHPHLTYLILYAIVMTYGAYGYVNIRRRDRAASDIDEWTDNE